MVTVGGICSLKGQPGVVWWVLVGWVEAGLRLVSAPRVSVCLLLKERGLKQKDQQWPAL